MDEKKKFDGTFRVYQASPDGFEDTIVFVFSLVGYPTASSLEKIRRSISLPDGQYVTLELRMYEVGF